MYRRLLAVTSAGLLSGCLGSAMVKTDAINFGDAIEETTNKLLVMNLLRARDKAPLHCA
jgi:hypothetical protein